MHRLISQQNLLKTLTDRLADRNLADEFLSKISSIGDQYSLTLGEVGKVYDLIDKIVGEEISRGNLLENLLQKLGVTEEEIGNVAKSLEKEILKPLEVNGIIEPLKANSEIKDIEKKLELVKKEIAKRKT
jgi:hypothetical protein